MDKEKVKELSKKYNLDEKTARKILKKPSEKEIIERANERANDLKKRIPGIKKFKLKKWKSPKKNPNWDHDHCSICWEKISDLKGTEHEAYADEENFDWICKSCFKKYILG